MALQSRALQTIIHYDSLRIPHASRGGMNMNFPNRAFWRLALLALMATLLACGSPRAPIRDQGRTFPNQGPEIVSGGGPVSFHPVDESDPTATPGVHRVREGDTLVAIAFMYGLDYRELAADNDLSPPYTIYVDQQLILSADAAGRAAPTGATASTTAAVPSGGIQRRPIERRASAPTPAPAPAATANGQPASASSSGGWQWPLADRGSTNYRPDINNRLDIEARAGESVLAARDGEVVYSRPFGDDEGSLLIIRHDDRYLSAYTQTGRVLVETGERVSAGQAIVELEPVESGSPMVYFNVQRDGNFVDPTGLLP